MKSHLRWSSQSHSYIWKCNEKGLNAINNMTATSRVILNRPFDNLEPTACSLPSGLPPKEKHHGHTITKIVSTLFKCF